MTGTYALSPGAVRGTMVVTFFGSDEDSRRKGWRSIGCTTIAEERLLVEVAAIEKSGRTLETRTAREMALAIMRRTA